MDGVAHLPTLRAQLEVPDDRRRSPAVGRVDGLGSPPVQGPDARRLAGDVIWDRSALGRAVLVDEWRRAQRLLASAHPEAEPQRSGEVLARARAPGRHVAGVAVRSLHDDRDPGLADE